MKYVCLFILVVQNSSLALLMRLSRTWGAQGEGVYGEESTKIKMYSASTAVVLAEVVKLILSLIMILHNQGYHINEVKRVIREDVVSKGGMVMMVPGTLYIIQNNLAYLAVSNLSAATYQITYQMKILTTAMFSVLLLRRKLGKYQWMALILLGCGVALVQLAEKGHTSPSSSSSSSSSPSSPSGSDINQSMEGGDNPIVGLGAVLAACLTSGFAGVYFEKVVKKEKKRTDSLWIRNVQLSFIGVVFGLGAVLLHEGSVVWERGFFYGYNRIVWLVILDSAIGGLMVALVVKYANSILKGFATSFSILLSSLISIFILNFYPPVQWIVGTSMVLVATLLYTTL